MKAVYLKDSVGPNPAFSRKAARAAKRRKEKYDVPATIEIKAGTENEHPDCWILCCLPEPVCRPADGDCHERVTAFLESPERKAQLARIKQMAQPAVFEKLPKELQEYVKAIHEKWFGDGESEEDSDVDPAADAKVKAEADKKAQEATAKADADKKAADAKAKAEPDKKAQAEAKAANK